MAQSATRSRGPDERAAKRLRPPFIEALSNGNDWVALEEVRRTMWTCYILEVFESASVGWPAVFDEQIVRVLLPCSECVFETGACGPHTNVPFWPDNAFASTSDAENATINRDGGPPPALSSFAWLCRICLLISRVAGHNWRPLGMPVRGPLAPEPGLRGLRNLSDAELLETDNAFKQCEAALLRDAGTLSPAPNLPLVMSLYTLYACVPWARGTAAAT